jgi:hypothetical protein
MICPFTVVHLRRTIIGVMGEGIVWERIELAPQLWELLRIKTINIRWSALEGNRVSKK